MLVQIVYLRDCDLESLADSLKHCLVTIAADKGDGKTLGTETTSTANAVQVGVGITWHVVVDSQVDTLDVDTTPENVGSNTDSLVELLEFLVSANTVWLSVSVVPRLVCSGQKLTAPPD